jgi:Transposase, Mutator family
VKDFAEALMGAEAEAVCGAGYGERSPERVNRRNGYRERDWDTRVGTIELAVPKLREGSYFPDWLLCPRRRPEQASVSVIADAYLAGVSTRRVEKLVGPALTFLGHPSALIRPAGRLRRLVEGRFAVPRAISERGVEACGPGRGPCRRLAGRRAEPVVAANRALVPGGEWNDLRRGLGRPQVERPVRASRL